MNLLLNFFNMNSFLPSNACINKYKLNNIIKEYYLVYVKLALIEVYVKGLLLQPFKHIVNLLLISFKIIKINKNII